MSPENYQKILAVIATFYSNYIWGWKFCSW